MSQSEASSHDEVLHEKSAYLREHSKVLRAEGRALCQDSKKLRQLNALLAATNSNPNAARYRGPICASAKRLFSRPQISFSIDVPLRGCEHKSEEPHFKVFDETKILY